MSHVPTIGLRFYMERVGIPVNDLYHVEYEYMSVIGSLDLYARDAEDAALQTHMKAEENGMSVRITSIEMTVMH